MARLLALFKSNAKFYFQSNSQSWFPGSVSAFPFVFLHLETSYEEVSLPLSVLRWGADSRHIRRSGRKGRGWITAESGQKHVHFTKHLLSSCCMSGPGLGARLWLIAFRCVSALPVMVSICRVPHRGRHPPVKLDSTEGCPSSPHPTTCAHHRTGIR